MSRWTQLGQQGRGRRARRRRVQECRAQDPTCTVDSGRFSLAAGKTTVVELTLNAHGKRLLTARRRQPAMLTTTGPASISKTVTFIDKRSRKKRR
jgi:uncharacterized membrane protein